MFDGIPAMDLLPVPIVACFQDVHRLAETAVDMLLKQFEAPAAIVKPIVVPVQVTWNKAFDKLGAKARYRRALVPVHWFSVCRPRISAPTKPKEHMSKKLVAVVMGSKSDWDVMKSCDETLSKFGVAHECRVLSAHCTPEALQEWVKECEADGAEVFIAAAGGAWHLAGVVAAFTVLPVLGVPMESAALKGLDSLLSMVQMPGGIPVGTLAIGKPGATNAALLAISILGSTLLGVQEKAAGLSAPEQAKKILARKPCKYVVPPSGGSLSSDRITMQIIRFISGGQTYTGQRISPTTAKLIDGDLLGAYRVTETHKPIEKLACPDHPGGHPLHRAELSAARGRERLGHPASSGALHQEPQCPE